MPDTPVLRDGLLEGRTIALDGEAGGEVASAVTEVCRGLGARVEPFDPDAVQPAPDTLVVDAAGRFASAAATSPEGLGPLRAAADEAWVAVRAAATGSLIEAPGGGKVVLLAPAPGAGPHAEAARAALENMARTLSIEWARHDIRVTAIHPGPDTAAAEVAGLVAYLASPAGDYFSGCVFSLGGAGATDRA
jgi:NAD(P)-dependent dehydrogenase (short-subunit alcohol dehydrogenase family)